MNKFLLVVDDARSTIEATCDDVQNFPHEVIEFPSVLLRWSEKDRNYQEVSRFQKFCKPKKNPKLTSFCTNLTGITQEQVDAGEWFPDVLKSHYQWLLESVGDAEIDQVGILTCGMWDLQQMLPSELMNWSILQPSKIYSRVINIKDSYKTTYGLEKGMGLARMLINSGMEMEGRHHSGISDCHNTARIVQKLVSLGYVYTDLDFHNIKTRRLTNYLRQMGKIVD